MNNVMHLVKNNLLKLVMAILLAFTFAVSGIGHTQSDTTKKSTVTDPVSDDGSSQMLKSGSGWGG